MSLPDTYQEVEYIESTGTQYINTGYTPSVNTEIETEISWGSTQNDWAVFFWVTGSDSSSNWILWRIYYQHDYTGNIDIFNSWFCNSSYSQHQTTVTLDTFHNILLKKDSCTIDWTSYTISTSGTPYQSSIYLFCWNNWGSAWRYWRCKMKKFKMSNSWTLVRDYVPCYRKSDNVIGLYDLVNNVFYTNAWTGTFTKWPNIIAPTTWKIQHIYLYINWETKQVYPAWYTWQLYKETNFKSSSYWWFRVAWWWTESWPSSTSFNTSEWYIYNSWSHWACCITPLQADYDLFQSANAIKIVCDWIYYVNNSNTYWNELWIFGSWFRSRSANPFSLINCELTSWSNISYSTWYTYEFIIEKWWYWQFTTSNWAVYTCTKSRDQIVTTNSWWIFYPTQDSRTKMAWICLDQWSTNRMKDIHVYLWF